MSSGTLLEVIKEVAELGLSHQELSRSQFHFSRFFRDYGYADFVEPSVDQLVSMLRLAVIGDCSFDPDLCGSQEFERRCAHLLRFAYARGVWLSTEDRRDLARDAMAPRGFFISRGGLQVVFDHFTRIRSTLQKHDELLHSMPGRTLPPPIVTQPALGAWLTQAIRAFSQSGAFRFFFGDDRFAIHTAHMATSSPAVAVNPAFAHY